MPLNAVPRDLHRRLWAWSGTALERVRRAAAKSAALGGLLLKRSLHFPPS